jgi:hypothetical protein
MSEQPIKDKTAIAGIGWTPFSRQSGSTVMRLAAEASLNAIHDAGDPQQHDRLSLGVGAGRDASARRLR